LVGLSLGEGWEYRTDEQGISNDEGKNYDYQDLKGLLRKLKCGLFLFNFSTC
jgi:hypothetical protein